MTTCKKSPTGEHDWELSEGSMMFCNNDCFGTPGGDDGVMEEYEIVGYIKELEDEILSINKEREWLSANEPPKECEEFLCKLKWSSGLITFIVARWHPQINEWLDRHDTMKVRNVIEYQPLPDTLKDKCPCKWVEMRNGGMYCAKCEEPITVGNCG